jgi:hypothetical protein
MGPATVALLLALAACDTTDPAGPDRAPEADLALAVYAHAGDEFSAPSISFAVNPLGSRDDVTNRPDLDVRWDFEADGAWDTAFAPLEFEDCFLPDPLPLGSWRARLQVRDAAGNVSLAEAEKALPDWVPVGADLVLDDAHALVTWSSNEGIISCRIHADAWSWGIADPPVVVFEVLVDGEPVGTREGAPFTIARRECDRQDDWGSVRVDDAYVEIIDFMTPGTHTITVRADATDVVDEVDETNNTYSWEITFD